MNRKQHWGRLAAANTQQALSLSGQHSQGADKDKATPGRRSGPGKPAQGIPVEVPTIGSTARQGSFHLVFGSRGIKNWVSGDKSYTYLGPHE